MRRRRRTRVNIRICFHIDRWSNVLIVEKTKLSRPLYHRIGVHGTSPCIEGADLAPPFLREIDYDISNQNIIYTDNQGAIALAHNPQHHARTKHVDIQYHFVRDCVEDGTTRLKYCPTEDMMTDGLTKTLGSERHRKLARMMGMGVWQKSDEKKEKQGEAATDGEITRMRSGSDERISSPVSPGVTDVAAMSHVAVRRVGHWHT